MYDEEKLGLVFGIFVLSILNYFVYYNYNILIFIISIIFSIYFCFKILDISSNITTKQVNKLKQYFEEGKTIEIDYIKEETIYISLINGWIIQRQEFFDDFYFINKEKTVSISLKLLLLIKYKII